MRFASALARTTSGTLGAQLVSILLIPAVFRLYTPADFGAWATLQAVVVGVAAVATLRFDLAVVIEPDKTRAAALFWLSGSISLCVVAVLAMVCSVAHRWLAMDFISSGGRWWVALGWTIAVALNVPIQSWLLRHGQFGSIAGTMLVGTLGTNLAQIGLRALLPNASGLILGSALGAVAATIFALTGLARVPPPLRFVSPRAARDLLCANRRFPAYSLPFTLFSVLRERAPTILLASLVPVATLGAFSQAWRLTHIPAGTTSGIMRPVVFHAAAGDDPSHVGELVVTALGEIARFGAPWVGLLIAVPGDLLGILLGHQWRMASTFAAIFAVPGLLFAMCNWLDRLFDVERRQDLNLKIGAGATIVSIAALALFMAMGVNLTGAAMVQAAVLSVGYIAIIHRALRLISAPVTGLLRSLTKSAFLALFVAAAVLLSGSVALGALVALLFTLLSLKRLAWSMRQPMALTTLPVDIAANGLPQKLTYRLQGSWIF